MPRRGTKRRSSTPEDEEEEEDEVMDVFAFSQQAPEASQSVLPEKTNERCNLDGMEKTARDQVLLSLSRSILFKALDREPIDRTKLPKQLGWSKDRIASAAFSEAKDRLRNVFGFALTGAPKCMENLSPRYKQRYYVSNEVHDFEDGSHSKTIHSVHAGASMEKGLLLLTLALIFCKGAPQADGSRWILGRDLYRLLNDVDDSIPQEPPQQGTSRAKATTQSTQSSLSATSAPNVDTLLELFVQWDYLLKDKATDDNYTGVDGSGGSRLEDGDMIYSMGPRAALEVGRKQIIYFCAEILDEQPDPTMLKEVEGDDLEEVDDNDFMDPTPATMSQ